MDGWRLSPAASLLRAPYGANKLENNPHKVRTTLTWRMWYLPMYVHDVLATMASSVDSLLKCHPSAECVQGWGMVTKINPPFLVRIQKFQRCQN